MPAERRIARAGGGRRGPLRDLRQPCRGDDRGLTGRYQVRRRRDRALPQPGAGRAGQGAARGVAGAPGPGLQRGQDEDRPPRRWLRLPRVQRPPLPPQATDQAVQGGRQEAPGTARRRNAQAARPERGGGHHRAQPRHPGLGGLLPDGGVIRDLQLTGQLPMGAALQVGTVAPPGQAGALGRRPVLRQVLQIQGRPLGIRGPRQRRVPGQVLLDRHRTACAGQGHGIPR